MGKISPQFFAAFLGLPSICKHPNANGKEKAPAPWEISINNNKNVQKHTKNIGKWWFNPKNHREKGDLAMKHGDFMAFIAES